MWQTVAGYLCVWLLTVGHACSFNAKTDLSQVHYLYDEGLCSKNLGGPYQQRTIEVNRSTVVALSLNPSLTSIVHCRANFRAVSTPESSEHRNRLLVSLDEININRPWNLSVFESRTNGVIPATIRKNITYFTRSMRTQFTNMHDYLSNSDRLTINYDGFYSSQFFGLQLTLTVVTDDLIGGSCGAPYFRCKNLRLCISEELQCNGQYNCGLFDDSDEENCARLPDHTDYQQNYGSSNAGMGRIFAIMISTLLMFTTIMWISTLCLRRARDKRELRMRHARRELGFDPTFTRIDPSMFDSFLAVALHRGNPNISLMEPPPCYSVQNGLNTFELPPPYCVEMCDVSSGLLAQTRSEGVVGAPHDNGQPPAYETLPRQYESRGIHDADTAAALLQQRDNDVTGRTDIVPPYSSTSNVECCPSNDTQALTTVVGTAAAPEMNTAVEVASHPGVVNSDYKATETGKTFTNQTY